jgi:hypothetical protein
VSTIKWLLFCYINFWILYFTAADNWNRCLVPLLSDVSNDGEDATQILALLGKTSHPSGFPKPTSFTTKLKGQAKSKKQAMLSKMEAGGSIPVQSSLADQQPVCL